jgi:Uma2 family endonuclease
MSEPAKKKAAYEDLYRIPENMIGEIINGELIVTPRPSTAHSLASSCLGAELIPPYYHGRGGGPGGWVILDEPEIQLGENILVPDLAGWRKDRFSSPTKTNSITVTPDWVCEVMSPGTVRIDKMEKMPIYAEHGVPYLWHIDPVGKTLDVFRLKNGEWVVAGLYVEDSTVRTEPFTEIEIDLSVLWLEKASQKTE